jgi:uncharacterized membrane protein
MGHQVRDFELAEYHEAANAYHRGTEIGWTAVRGYITVNVLFVALIGAVSQPNAEAIVSASDMVKAVPFIALFVSLLLIFILPRYYRLLENCRRRAEEIEKGFGGKLFTGIGKIDRSGALTTALGLPMIILALSGFWGYFAMKVYNPEFQLYEAIGRLVGTSP